MTPIQWGLYSLDELRILEGLEPLEPRLLFRIVPTLLNGHQLLLNSIVMIGKDFYKTYVCICGTIFNQVVVSDTPLPRCPQDEEAS